jgi:DNA-binding transcriptional MocR family regulator
VSPIDFRRSLPPQLPSLQGYLDSALTAVGGRQSLAAIHRQSIAGAATADREAAAHALESRFARPVEPARLLITNGTQSAVLLLMRGLVGIGGLMLAERLSYGPLRVLARVAGVRLQGVEIDEDGIVPAAFEEACRNGRPSAMYCNPTVQNPTTAIAPQGRRVELVEIARRYGVAIIEDDPLGRLHPHAPEAIASIAPDVTWYVMGTTKCLAHGLRQAWLVAPSTQEIARVIGSVEQLSYWHPAPLLSALTTELIESGSAERIAQELMSECTTRENAAREVLRGFHLHSKPGSMHVWLDLPSPWRAREFVAVAERAGVLLRAADMFATDDRSPPEGVRLSLSGPTSADEVRSGLQAVRELLERGAS